MTTIIEMAAIISICVFNNVSDVILCAVIIWLACKKSNGTDIISKLGELTQQTTSPPLPPPPLFLSDAISTQGLLKSFLSQKNLLSGH